MKSHVMGVDLGSTTAKTVILDMGGRMVASNVVQMGSVSGDAVKASMAAALAQAGIGEADLARAVSTGYGRRMIDIVDKSYTEITCHARGAAALVPGARMVIDIGGQDSKVIAIDETGLVETFAMNDRCAGGTGKFLEVLARALDVELNEMGPLALTAKEELRISSMCATFAETEVISLLAEGRAKPDILGAVHAAIAKRTFGLVSRVGKRGPVVMTGGVANNAAAVHYIQKELGLPLQLAPTPQVAGALGAAILALEEHRANVRSGAAQLDEKDYDDGAMQASRACAPACKGQPDQAAPPIVMQDVHNLLNRH
jgi:(R)-2-hydroxyacyl-CoA dehydratese activating ATPase